MLLREATAPSFARYADPTPSPSPQESPRPPAGPTPSPAANGDRVDNALGLVRKSLDENGWFSEVTEGDLKDINHTLGELTASERTSVLSRLSDSELDHWGDEVNGGFNGLSQDARRDMFVDLAKSVDGEQLARIAKAFDVGDVTSAVLSHSNATQKQQYIGGLADQVRGGAQVDSGIFSQTISYGNAEAHATADVLASLADSPTQFSVAARTLVSAGKLDAVLEASTQRETSFTQGQQVSSSVESAQLTKIIDAAASGDRTLRTDVFESAAKQLKVMQSESGEALNLVPGATSKADHAADATGRAMSKLLTRDEATAAGVAAPPLTPPGVSLRDNIRQAKEHGPVWVTSDMVPNKKPWDYKQQGAQYQDFGNFNYGLAEAAAGLPENVALRGAGWAQHNAGTSDSTWGDPWDTNGGPYGDDPNDQAQIKAGYSYFESGLWRVW